MHTYKYKLKESDYDAYDVEADERIWRELTKIDTLVGDWDDKNSFAMDEWRAYYKDHMDRWGYDEKSSGHRYEVRAQYDDIWKTFKFAKRVDATAELKKLLSNNVCAVMVEVQP